jgi:hypothetical protein
MKKYFIALVLFAVTPSIAFASWWNPLSWNWTDFFNSPAPVVVEIPVATSTPVQTPIENSTTTATTSIPVVIATSTPTTTPVITKKIAVKVAVVVKPATTPIVVSTPVPPPVVQVQSTVATTTPVVPITPFVITSPSAGSLWQENTNQSVVWTPYVGKESDLITYQIIIGNTATNISQQVFDNVLDRIINTQTSASFPATQLLEEFSTKSGIPENQINTDFYVQVNAVNPYISSDGILASTPRIPITIPITPTVTVTASTTTVSSKSASAIVSWTSANATSCSLNISPLPTSEALIGTTTTEGSLSTGTLTTPTTYTITCVNGTSTSAIGDVKVGI